LLLGALAPKYWIWLRAERDESRGGYWRGESSESHNPMDGIGMKQGREGASGIKRQEVEKA
jgi:hypothetical protein